MELQLMNKVIFISGGSRGIGRDIVISLLKEGAMVSTCSRNIDDLKKLQASLSDQQRKNLLIYECNVMDELMTSSIINNTIEKWGRLDAIVANAGIGITGKALETTNSDWILQFETKIFSVLNLVRPSLPELIKSDSARIIIINSVTSKFPDCSMAAVSCSRSAVKQLAFMLAKDLADNQICVNWINLGAIQTDRQFTRYKESHSQIDYQSWLNAEIERRGIPFGRFGEVQDVSPMVLMLLSPLSSYITATGIDIAGGLYAIP